VTVTLAQIEQEVASRAAVWEDHVAAGGTANPATAVVADILSTADGGGTYPGQWLLRRSATAADRQRRITSVDPATGTLTLERPYAAAPTAGEALEITPLDPARQLRRAVIAGLARCFFVDRVDVPVTAGRVEQDLSAALFWVTDVGQIRDVRNRAGAVGTVLPADLWSRTVSSSGGVGVEVAAAPAGVYVVEALRPHATWVNGADAPDGPSLDADVLSVPLEYAAAAGHVELWRRARQVLAPVASGPQRLAAPLSEATAVFNLTVRQQWWYWDRPDRVRTAISGDRAVTATAEFVTSGVTWDVVASRYSWRGLSALTWRQVLAL
jgi:hypothetical protein